MLKNFISIGQLTLTVAWMLGSAYVFSSKDIGTGVLFMALGFLGILILRLIEHEYFKELKYRGYI